MGELILIVDDEPDIAGPLEYAFRREGFRTASAGTGAEALRLALGEPRPDLVILDLMLPDLPGTEVYRRLRAAGSAVPVVALTARGDEADRVLGFEMGLDDYVVKPFSTRELVLRVRAVLRRVQAAGAAAPEAPRRLEAGPLRLDLDGHRAWVDGEEVALTPLEFRLLRTLAERRGRVQTRERLLEDVWEMAPSVTTRTVDSHVRRLRQKLGRAADLVETVRGVGYRFAAAPEPS